MTKKEYILCAALRVEDGEPILAGHRHSDIYLQIQHFGLDNRGDSLEAVQGFLTSTGRFVARNTAYEIALKAGQIEPNKTKLLISEDLY